MNIVANTDARFDGNVVLIDAFGSWCPPCMGAIPHLNELQVKYRDRGLEIVGVDFERSTNPRRREAKGRKIVKKFDIQYTVLAGSRIRMLFDDHGDVFGALPDLESVDGFPTLIFVGRDGAVRTIESEFDPETSPAPIEALLVRLLDEAA